VVSTRNNSEYIALVRIDYSMTMINSS